MTVMPISHMYDYKEPIHINDEGHIDTKNMHLVIKDVVNSDHAVLKGQLDQVKTELQTNITDAINAFQAQVEKQIVQLHNSR